MMPEISFMKLVGAVAIIGTLGTGGYKTIDLVWKDGNWQGQVIQQLKVIPEIKSDVKDIKKDMGLIQRDISVLLERVPGK